MSRSSQERENRGDAADFQLRMVGVNHRTAPASVREILAYAEPETVLWIQQAKEGEAFARDGMRVREAALLSTCNRTEAYLVLSGTPRGDARGDPAPTDGEASGDLLRRFTLLLCGPRDEVARDHPEAFCQFSGAAAARHLLRVASGLDSMVQGEAQILGQVHRAFELAREAGGIGPVLDRLFTSAFRAGKRSRHETDIGRGAVSVASAAVELAVKVVGSLDRRVALVVGAGDTGRLVARHFSSQKPHELWVANRTVEKARALARELDGRAFGLDDLPRIMGQADVIAVATFAPQPVITRAMVQTALRHRRRSTVFIDISMPRNVEPSVHGVGEAFVYDMDALQRIVKENLSRREEEAPKVHAILEEEMAQFTRWTGTLSAAPMIATLRDRFERIRAAEVQRHAGRLSPDALAACERVSRGLLNKFLHGPTIHLRNGGAGDPAALDLLQRMFQLDEEGVDPSGGIDGQADSPGDDPKVGTPEAGTPEAGTDKPGAPEAPTRAGAPPEADP